MATAFDRRFRFPLDILSRGLRLNYRQDELNRCPGCGRSHWYVGRTTAQCAFCETAVPLAETDMLGAGLTRCAHARKLGGDAADLLQ